MMALKSKKRNFPSLSIPKLTFRDTPINGFLVFTIVIFAFILGMLTNKVIYPERDAKTKMLVSDLAEISAALKDSEPLAGTETFSII